MSSCREIVSLQFGHYSNYVGAHFWNIQELSFDYTGKKACDVNHDVMYRQGKTIDGQTTYTPRVILADLKGSLKSLPESGGLEKPNPESILDWPTVEKQEDLSVVKNDYLKYIDGADEIAGNTIDEFDFVSNVNTWTDFLYARLHNRSINVINEFKHDDSEIPFETFNSGWNIWKGLTYSETFVDNIRYYAEECDNIQGFQVTLDAVDGFGGLACNSLQYLVDDYPGKAIYAIPLIASYFPDNSPQNQKERDASNVKDSTRLVNLVLAFESLFENSSLFTPMCLGEKGWRKPGEKREFFNTIYDSKNNYQTSAIIAAALDTISLKYRQKKNEMHLSDICSDLTGFGRNMASASLGLPFDMKQKDDLIDHLDKVSSPLWTSITPGCSKIGTDKVFQHISVRGIPESKLKRPLRSADKQIQMAAYQCNNVKEMFELYFQCSCYATATNVTVFHSGLELKTPFPKLFSENLNGNGFLKEFVDNETAEQLPVIAGIHNGNFMFETLENLLREAKRIKLGKLHKFREEGLEDDDFTECLDKIAENQGNYEDNYEL